VLLHEFAHLRRGDSRWRFFAATVCAAWWFHPAVWFALRALRAEQEYASDALAVASCSAPLDYAQTLVDLAPRFGDREQGSAPAIIGRSQLARRVEAILHPPAADGRGGSARIAALVLFAALSVLVALVRPFDPARRLAPLAPMAPSDSSLQSLGPLSSLDVVLDMDDVAQPANRR
jgi:beta-lactamase regulating signal transducer with metallopeptidase domain